MLLLNYFFFYWFRLDYHPATWGNSFTFKLVNEFPIWEIKIEVFCAKQCLHLHFLLLITTGYYNTIQLLEAIALHLDSVNGIPCIWEELVSCFLRLFSDDTANYEDCISYTNTHGDEALEVSSKFSTVFFEQFTRESWKARCRWWAHHHFNQNSYTSETRSGRSVNVIYIE